MNKLIFTMQRKPQLAEFHYHYQLPEHVLDLIVEDVKSELGEVNILQIGDVQFSLGRVKVVIQQKNDS